MLENKRTFKRYDLPLIVKFRPTYGLTTYSLGLTKNLSWQGIGLESRNFNFILNENLELELRLPQNAASVSLRGDVVWKRDEGNTSYAGIKFKVGNKKLHNKAIEEISTYTNIPLSGIIPGKKIIKKSEKKTGEKPALKTPKAATEAKSEARTLGFTKRYTKNSTECNVTFILPKEAAPEARTITIVGDFNEWNTKESPMKRLKNGDFQATMKLSSGREYRFRYLIDDDRWENDWHADKYVPNSFGSDDSVVIV